MAYVSKVWVDRQTEYPTRRKLAFDDGTGDKIVTVSREEGQIYEAGDIFDANTMNTLESRIAAGIAEKQDILIPGNGIRIDQDNVISATGGGGGIEFTKIESGSLVSVNDAADLPVVDLAVEIEAVQSGTGDPSPSNERPLIGASGLNIYNQIGNFWDEQWEVGTLNDTTGQPASSTTQIRAKNFSPCKGGASYYVKVGSGNAIRVFWYDASNNYLGQTQNIQNSITTAPDNATYLKIRGTNAYGTTYGNDISINCLSTDTAYHAYVAPTVYPITWQTEAGTVYGCLVNPVTGAMTVTHGKTTLNDLTIYRTTSYTNPVFYANLAGRMLSSTFGMADKLKYIGIKANAQAFSGDSVDYDFAFNSRNEQIYIRADSYSDVTQFKTALGSTEIVYELAQPVTVQLTPTEIETLLGINNIWADSGDILNLEYYTQSASDVRDFIIKDEEVTDAASWSSEKIQDELDTKQETLTAGDGIVFDGNEISAVLYKELTANLQPPATSVVFNDASITTSSTIDIYTSQYGFNPETVTVETGKITLTFRSVESSVGVKVRVS